MQRNLYFLFLLLISFISAIGQHPVSFHVRDGASLEKLEGVSVVHDKTKKGGSTDTAGTINFSLPAGPQQFTITIVGYETKTITLNFPLANPIVVIDLQKQEEEINEVIINSSRTDSRIENTPSRVEVLGSEEVEEESGVKPSHIASLLGDVAGIQSQQTSAVTASTDLRIQGLPGNYTQLLRDGMPLFGGYSGSFSILQIPPLDIKQIEIIKGASSTLYGGGAIAGMINIISKKPRLGIKERMLLLNQSTLKETNINVFLSERTKKVGYTFFTGGNYQRQMDINNDGYSDLPLTEDVFFHPTLFFYPNEKNTVSVGINSNFEERKGGDIEIINGYASNFHQFYIRNQTDRNTIDVSWESKLNQSDKITVKGIGSSFNRDITTNVFGMAARQVSWYTEASLLKKIKDHDIVAGTNINGEKLTKSLPDSSLISNYRYITVGFFLQDDWKINSKMILETGFRSDFNSHYGGFALPRISILYNLSASFTARIGGGMGYKIPTVFENEIDERDYKLIKPIADVKPEKSYGVNCDINFKKKLGAVRLTLNQSFYYTKIDHPVILQTSSSAIDFFNAAKPVSSKGIETWAQVSIAGLDAYLGYTVTDAQKKYDLLQPNLELSARNKIAAVVSYEFSSRFRVCVEASHTGKQYLDNGGQSPSYSIFAAMLRYDLKRISFVLNCENMFDYRQTKKENILIPPLTNPRFKQIWGPLDGRGVNLSMKLSF
jgi:outer membrane receptor for ferrienterochelin and colicins